MHPGKVTGSGGSSRVDSRNVTDGSEKKTPINKIRDANLYEPRSTRFEPFVRSEAGNDVNFSRNRKEARDIV